MNVLLFLMGGSEPLKRFFDPMLKGKVTTVKYGKNISEIQVKSCCHRRPLAINSFKKVLLARVMSFENAPVPFSLFEESGKMVANKKSDFL